MDQSKIPLFFIWLFVSNIQFLVVKLIWIY